jgi:hypothetical protein
MKTVLYDEKISDYDEVVKKKKVILIKKAKKSPKVDYDSIDVLRDNTVGGKNYGNKTT